MWVLIITIHLMSSEVELTGLDKFPDPISCSKAASEITQKMHFNNPISYFCEKV